MADKGDFSMFDNAIFIIMLVVSLGIGIYNGCFGKKNTTAKDMLVAGRKMTVILNLFIKNCRDLHIRPLIVVRWVGGGRIMTGIFKSVSLNFYSFLSKF